MGKKQAPFLMGFKEAFEGRFGGGQHWDGGQGKENRGQLKPNPQLRRNGEVRQDEYFELGDLRVNHGRYMVIVEFDSECLDMHNLVKYWPFICSELTLKPTLPIALCHFSDWYSFGSYRDLWNWLEDRMEKDPKHRVNFYGRQFDHGGGDQQKRDKSIQEAISWLEGKFSEGRPAI